MTRVVVLSAFVCAMAGTAAAAPSTSVFPLTAPNLPMRIATAPEELAKALGEELDADVLKVSIEDAALTLECEPKADTCLEELATFYKKKRIVFGAIEMVGETKLKVTLTRFDVVGPERAQKSFTVEGDVEEMSEQLVELSKPLFGSKATPEEEPEEPDAPLRPDPPASGAISGTTWLVLGSGALATTVGLGFLLKAHSISNEVSTLPRNTVQDFRDLTAREDDGQRDMVIGGLLTAIGGAVVVYGVIRVVSERKTPAAEPSALSHLVPMPLRGGGGLAFSMEWP